MTDYTRFNLDVATLRAASETESDFITIPKALAVRLLDDIYEMDRHLPDFFDDEYDPDAPDEDGDGEE